MWPFKKKEYFKVGDNIKCIDDRDWNSCEQTMNLKLGHTYKVLLVVKCPVCSCICYDIGCKFHNSTTYTECMIGKLNNHELPGMGIHLAGHFTFEKSVEAETEQKTEQSAEKLQEQINEYVLEEEFEKAGELKKELDKKK